MSNCSKNCSNGDLPWQGRGASLDITGCRFSLYPMDSDFISIILQALEKTDTSKVWCKTDALSTVYRGKLIHVVDTVEALFIQAYKENVHMALEGQFSKGCPGDTDGDSFLSVDDVLQNQPLIADKHFLVNCKIALYPLGCEEYIEHIAHVVRLVNESDLSSEGIHYATRLTGDVQEVFQCLKRICEYCEKNTDHYVLTFTLSVNSPTKEEAK